MWDIHERGGHGVDQRRESVGDAARIARDHSFQTPIDEEDAAARCVAPVLEGVRDEDETPPFGKFFKDYRESEW